MSDAQIFCSADVSSVTICSGCRTAASLLNRSVYAGELFVVATIIYKSGINYKQSSACSGKCT